MDDSEEPTLRDRFAMAAVAGVAANPNYDLDFDVVALWAYLMADEMLAARVPDKAKDKADAS